MDELLYGTLHSISIQQQQQQEEEEQQPAPGNNHMVSWGSYQIQNNYNNNNNINNNDINSNYISTAPVLAFGDEHGTGNIPVVYGSDHMGSGNSSSGISSSSDAAASSLLMVAEIRRNNSEEEVSSAIRAKIASHPLYPKLMEAYIDCQKVGAPPELAHVLDEIRREGDVSNKNSVVSSCCWGDDPELDEFMETYCDILVKYKSDLSKPFNEASSFLDNMETQLSNLCNGFSRSYVSDEAGGSSEEDLSGGETEVPECSRPPPPPPVDREIKDKLMSKYGGYIRSLKLAFSKKKKKGKLPKEARQILFDWWNLHYNWPYPTEADKVALAESTGLDQRQINNWFINQRKRHWKPSENMQFNLMDGLYGPYFHE